MSSPADAPSYVPNHSQHFIKPPEEGSPEQIQPSRTRQQYARKVGQSEIKQERHDGTLQSLPSINRKAEPIDESSLQYRLRKSSISDSQENPHQIPQPSPKHSATFPVYTSKAGKRAREDETAESLSDSDSHRPNKRASPTPDSTQADRSIPASRRLSYSGHDAPAPSHAPSPSKSKSSLQNSPDAVKSENVLFRQPETKPITEDQLVGEVKGIYGGLVMVEKKCIEIVQQQSQTSTKLTKEQWQALIALHRTLLHEHHDFFSASQHPTASPALRRLANKYAMPARMWRHGIHAFLELLRHRLPDSLDHMLSFVYLAYSMMALLMESVPSFVETWIECLGDLARYRMAIEEVDLRDREIWSNVARMWYNKAADLSPNIGRIQHHLAVLARPNIVQQLFFYSKALVSVVPFPNARESIMLLFTPLLEHNAMMHPRYPLMESSLVTAAGFLFTRRSVTEFKMYIDQFLKNLDPHFTRTSSKYKVQGPEVASSLFSMMMDFGSKENSLWNLFTAHCEKLIMTECEKKKSDRKDVPINYVVTDPVIKEEARESYWSQVTVASDVKRISFENLPVDGQLGPSDDISAHSGLVLYDTISAVTSRIGDKNIVPFMHLVLATLQAMSYVPNALVYIEACIPWEEVANFLNNLSRSYVNYADMESPSFPSSYHGATGRQLPEDFGMRGLMTMQYYFPADWFTVDLVDEDERLLEFPSHQAPRAERCLWCGVRIATLGRYLSYDFDSKRFEATPFAKSLTEFKAKRDSQFKRDSVASDSLMIEDDSKMEIEVG